MLADPPVPRSTDRRIAFLGVLNFRDLGGYATSGGGRTRWGHIYRSDTLSRLAPDDIEAFHLLGVETFYDLRRPDECEKEPGPLACINLVLPSRRVFDTDPATLRDRHDGERWLLEDYLGMLANAGPVFGQLYAQLAHPAAKPAVFHCAGGKDRTGMTAALLLLARGVDRETVLDDYELTGQYGGPEHVPEVVDSFVQAGISREAAEGMISAPRWAMAEALRELDRTHGGIEAYLRGPARLAGETLAQLRQRLIDQG
ncbi:MAG TPA: tyrosine-protein phosphatase [Acidimicrobiales bacterium]|nr:tyrosine-protein phosphatase [Acidimicrobiales bacterium]